MDKSKAADLFGGRHQDLADAVGLTLTTIAHWPAELKPWMRRVVIGAAVEAGKIDASNVGKYKVRR